VTSPCAMTCSSVDFPIPSGVAISYFVRKRILGDCNKISLNQMKDYNDLKQSRLQEREDIQAHLFI